MGQYISKSALVAEIEKLKHRIDDRYSYSNGWIDALLMVEAELDTLEVKEMDLSWKDIRLIAEIGEEFMNSEESDAYANDEEAYYTAILNKLKEKGLNYRTQRQRIRDIKTQKGK